MPPSFKFGEDLQLDLGAYELRRAGRPVRLERIPMEILLLLIERRAELVTREQIVEKIWGKDVFVDTDNSINGAIRKLRQALRDDPENPRFITTITGKGYRFIAPLLEDEQPRPVVIPPPPMAPTPAVEVAQSPASRKWPVLLAALALLGAIGAYLTWSRTSVTPPQPGERVMLAVLPFENLTGDPGQDYFSDGLTEEMITRLANLAPRRLGVIARTSAMQFKQPGAAFDKLTRELGVQYVLEGSVRRDSGRLRITAQLIQVRDQSPVWAQQYDRDQSDILTVQAEIAQAIAEQIESTLGDTPTTPAHPAPLSPQGYEAYDQYLRGMYFWNKRTREDFGRAIASFQQAIAGNPGDARAYAGLADSYTLMASYGYAPAAEVIPKAREAALRALQIDERLAAAHTSLALISEFYDRDRKAAEKGFRRAIELDLNYVIAHHWYAEFLAFQGRFDEALAEIERARQLDPLSPIIAADHGAILYFGRQYDRAIQQFRFVLAIEPTIGRARLIVAAYAQQGKFTEALAHIHEWKDVQEGPWPLAWAAYVYGRAGRQAEAEQALREMEELNHVWKLEPFGLRLTAYMGMGRMDDAIACLQEACEQRPDAIIAMKVDPIFDPLRSDPRFRDVLRCMHLDQ